MRKQTLGARATQINKYVSVLRGHGIAISSHLKQREFCFKDTTNNQKVFVSYTRINTRPVMETVTLIADVLRGDSDYYHGGFRK